MENGSQLVYRTNSVKGQDKFVSMAKLLLSLFTCAALRGVSWPVNYANRRPSTQAKEWVREYLSVYPTSKGINQATLLSPKGPFLLSTLHCLLPGLTPKPDRRRTCHALSSLPLRQVIKIKPRKPRIGYTVCQVQCLRHYSHKGTAACSTSPKLLTSSHKTILLKRKGGVLDNTIKRKQ